MRETQAAADSGAASEMVAALLAASQALVAISARSLAAVDETLTMPRFRVLVVLENAGPTNLAGLAECLAVNPSIARRMVDRLSASGIVERTPDPADGRVTKIAATAAGRTVVREVTARRQADIARIFAAMPGGDQKALPAALRVFTEAAGKDRVAPAVYAAFALPG
ncbi:MarR family transcriptional regulator [Streptomyces sp. NPDC005246]|uniref:MarR family winged helix-turn-helix transcriptional regulator n=1 Tax=Streptomyces sp. NPDC005246 TaxID=3156716 RepID=UPI0033B3DA62